MAALPGPNVCPNNELNPKFISGFVVVLRFATHLLEHYLR